MYPALISQDLEQADLARDSTQLLVRSLPWATVEGHHFEVCCHIGDLRSVEGMCCTMRR